MSWLLCVHLCFLVKDYLRLRATQGDVAVSILHALRVLAAASRPDNAYLPAVDIEDDVLSFHKSHAQAQVERTGNFHPHTVLVKKLRNQIIRGVPVESLWQ